MATALLTSGIVFGVLLIANTLLQTFGRSKPTSTADWLLAIPMLLLSTGALIINSTQETPDVSVDRYGLWLGLAVGGISLLILLVELSRKQPLRRSRGLIGFLSGMLVAAATFIVPFLVAYAALIGSNPPPTPEMTAEATTDPNSEPQLIERSDRFNELFAAVRQVVAEEIGIDEVLLFTQLDQGIYLADIVAANGGDVNRVVQRISEIMRAGVRAAASAGEMNPIEAALLVSQMETLIGLAVRTDIVIFSARFGGPTPVAEGARPSLLTLLTETPAPSQNTTQAPSPEP